MNGGLNERFQAVVVLAVSSPRLLIGQVVCYHDTYKLGQFCLLPSTVQLSVHLPRCTTDEDSLPFTILSIIKQFSHTRLLL